MRSERQYENFMLEIEWRHMEAGGNPGVFLWCDAIPDERNRLPKGMGVRMLELDWVNLHRYVVVAVDGNVKLSINGKFVNGIRDASVRKGYICLESEGREIHFRNIRILELPGGLANESNTAPEIK